ncbi:hypothetical protein [Methylobacter svalbardensis]|uniref:hypothetical protein n=1 Tax=Methylobacter svalbardensis TaxID=3080016 RepID=UPI0030EF959B
MVDSLGMFQLSGLPESTIATIVETYSALKKQNLPEHEILTRIEGFRSKISSGDMPNPLNLNSHIQYCVDLEHSHGAPISEDFITKARQISSQHFTRFTTTFFSDLKILTEGTCYEQT